MLLLFTQVACAGTPPEGQPALRRLTAETLPAFHAEFDAHPEAYRVVVLLSPT
jgi:hypothetical protein